MLTGVAPFSFRSRERRWRDRIMTSDKKKETNRRNALKSTGPRTPKGKAAVRLNALKHGLLSQEILLPGEDGEALRELRERLRAELQPVGELENLLVDRIIDTFWRLGRLGRVETGIFTYELYGQLAERAEKEAHTFTRTETRYQDLIEDALGTTTITDEEKHAEARSRARKLRSEQQAETATLGRTFVRDADKANAFS
jgi:hypothetical protein